MVLNTNHVENLVANRSIGPPKRFSCLRLIATNDRCDRNLHFLVAPVLLIAYPLFPVRHVEHAWAGEECPVEGAVADVDHIA